MIPVLGVVVENVEDASHIVVSQSVMDPEDKECYYRILDQRGSKAFVHWWYRPDSYDTWMVFGGGGYQTGNASSEKAKIMPSLFLPKSGVWTLSVEWLYLSEKYNEWMNEGDFELSQMESTSSEDNENDSVLLGSPTLRKQAAGAAGAPLSSQGEQSCCWSLFQTRRSGLQFLLFFQHVSKGLADAFQIRQKRRSFHVSATFILSIAGLN